MKQLRRSKYKKPKFRMHQTLIVVSDRFGWLHGVGDGRSVKVRGICAVPAMYNEEYPNLNSIATNEYYVVDELADFWCVPEGDLRRPYMKAWKWKEWHDRRRPTRIMMRFRMRRDIQHSIRVREAVLEALLVSDKPVTLGFRFDARGEDHFMTCVNCGKEFDCRDPSIVFHHEGDCMLDKPVQDIEHSGSRKVGEPVLHTKNNGDINLN